MKMRVPVILILMALGMAIMGLTGCDHYNCSSGANFGSSACTSTGTGLGGGGTSASAPAVLDFFVNGGALGAAEVDTSGNFYLVPNFVSPQQDTLQFDGMAIAQKQWLYVDLISQIEAYSISSAGALTAITGSPFPSSNTESSSFTTDPAGKFLFMCGANNDQVTVFAINQSNGSLTTVGSFATGFFADQASTDGQGKFLYVTAGNLGTEVDVFSIGSSGALTPVVGNPFPITIAQLAGEPTGKFMLGVTGNGANNGFTPDDHVYVFSINQSTGALTQVVGSPFATNYTPDALAVHPSGTFVYTFNQTGVSTSPMEGFQFNTNTGALTPLGTSPFTALTANAGMFDQSGTYLLMHPTTTLTAASVNTTTGALTALGTPITNVGSSAGGWAVTDPN